MKRFIILIALMAMAVVVAAEAGRYSVEVTSNSNGENRQVIVFDSETGDFYMYDVDHEGLDRQNNEVYIPCVKFNHKAHTREVIKIVK